MTHTDKLSVEDLLGSTPEITPAEMMASFDPGTWALARAILESLVAKGVLNNDDLRRMHADILKTAKSFADVGETRRDEDVRNVADWLDRFASGSEQR